MKGKKAAELDDDDGGMHGNDASDALDAVLGGVATDALIDDAVSVTALVEITLQEVGVAFPRFGAEAGSKAVTEADDDGASVVREGGVWRVGSGG